MYNLIENKEPPISSGEEETLKYCSHCGNEILDDAVVCPKCGCPTELYRANSNSTQSDSGLSGMAMAVKVFMILACIAAGFAFLIPLAWTLPMTIIVCRRLNNREPIGVGFKICILLFCNLIAGILLLCMDTQDYYNRNSDNM